mgnify:CR=1 FL=1|jgi:hypothetical protein
MSWKVVEARNGETDTVARGHESRYDAIDSAVGQAKATGLVPDYYTEAEIRTALDESGRYTDGEFEVRIEQEGPDGPEAYARKMMPPGCRLFFVRTGTWHVFVAPGRDDVTDMTATVAALCKFRTSGSGFVVRGHGFSVPQHVAEAVQAALKYDVPFSYESLTA